jgi:hypothetical protein
MSSLAPIAAAFPPAIGRRRQAIMTLGWAIYFGSFVGGVILLSPALLNPRLIQLLSFIIMIIAALAITRVGMGGLRVGGIVALLFASTMTVLTTVEIDQEKQAYRETVARTTATNLASAIKQYSSEFGSFPAGNRIEITRALLGNNPRKTVFFEPRAGAMSPAGELLDPWGAPYRFDLSDPKNPKIYSFGKDGRDDSAADSSDDICSWKQTARQ